VSFVVRKVTDVSEMKSQGELGDTLNVRIRCGVPPNFELKEQVRRMLRDWIPSDSALVSRANILSADLRATVPSTFT